jgi:hypothetical protein
MGIVRWWVGAGFGCIASENDPPMGGNPWTDGSFDLCVNWVAVALGGEGDFYHLVEFAVLVQLN